MANIDFQPDTGVDFQPETLDFQPEPTAIKEPEAPSIWSRIKSNVQSGMANIGQSREEAAKTALEGIDQPAINFSPKLFQLPAPYNMLLPEVNREVSEHAAGAASGLTSIKGMTIGAAVIAAPEIALPILTGVAAKGAGAAAGRMTAELEQGNIAKAAGEAVDVGANVAMAMPGMVGAVKGFGKAEAITLEAKPPPLPERPPPLPKSATTEPPTTIEAGEPKFAVGERRPPDLSVFNRVNSGQWNFYFGRMGEAAQDAWTRMALSEMKMRESIGRNIEVQVNQTLNELPKPMRKQGAKAFTELLDGQTIDEITASQPYGPAGEAVIGAATKVKDFLEDIRKTILETKRGQLQDFLRNRSRKELDDIAESAIGDRPPPEISTPDVIEGITRTEYADDWGIADGTYFPHIFSGQWKVSAEDGSFVTRANTPLEAKILMREIVAGNPDLQNATFKIEPSVFIPADVIRLGDKQFFKQLNKIAKALEVPKSEVAQAQLGVLGRKAAKQKFFGNLMRREGAQNYEKSFQKSMTAYIYGVHRWKVLSQLQREVAPLIEQVKNEGRGQAAGRLEMLMENLWGKPAASTLEFDNLLRRIPFLEDRIAPLALDRWTRSMRGVTAGLTLTTARFAVVNRLQPLQGLYPLLGARRVIQAKMLQHSPEGRALLDQFGVTYDIGQYGELGIPGKVAHFRERLTGETSNQEVAFLAMYQHARDLGLEPQAAADYGKLRGQLMTQFTPLIVDRPQLMEGPLTASIFQYKRFSIKQGELLATMARDRNAPGIARWMAALSVTGGAVFWLKQTYLNDPARLARLKDALQKDVGEKNADLALYGLPGFLGVDLSGSLVTGDAPFGRNIYEKIGYSLMPPSLSIGLRAAQAATAQSREPQTAEDRLVNTLRRIPSLKPLAELMAAGDMDVHTPDGELAYKRRIGDALAALGSFRSANESNQRLAIDGIFALKKEMQDAKNEAWVAEESGNEEKAAKIISDFNARWPEMAISQKEFRNYGSFRRNRAGKTDIERLGTGKLKELVPDEQRQ